MIEKSLNPKLYTLRNAPILWVLPPRRNSLGLCYSMKLSNCYWVEAGSNHGPGSGTHVNPSFRYSGSLSSLFNVRKFCLGFPTMTVAARPSWPGKVALLWLSQPRSRRALSRTGNCHSTPMKDHKRLCRVISSIGILYIYMYIYFLPAPQDSPFSGIYTDFVVLA